jgi:two-component system, cell cycle sensor histidine kinase and response regulator CckA
LAVLDAEAQVDLLFTDLEMDENPLMGTEVAAAFRERRPNLPVLYTSGTGVTDGTRALFVAFSAFLAKPYTVQQLTEAVRQAIERT